MFVLTFHFPSYGLRQLQVRSYRLSGFSWLEKASRALPDRVQVFLVASAVAGGTECLHEAILTEFFVTLKDFSHSVGVD